VAGQADGVILVYQAGKVGRLVLKRAKAHLESARAKVWGVVLNDVQTEIAGYAYSHYYTHYYGEETPGESTRGSTSRFLDGLRTRLGGFASRLPRGESEPASRVTDASRGVDVLTLPPTEGSRHRWLIVTGIFGLVLLAGLAVFIAWQLVGRGSPQTSRDQLRRKMDSPTAPVPPRPTPATPMPPAPSTSNLERTDDVATLPPLAPSLAAPSTTPSDAPSLATKPEFSRPIPSPDPPAAMPDPVPPRPAQPRPQAQRIAPARPADPPPAFAARPVPAPETRSPAPSTVAPPPAEGATRFAVEFGPFPTASEAERVERQLSQAGHQTVRFRQQTGAALYAVLIERVADPESLIDTLREQGFADAVLVRNGAGPSVRVGEPMVLRGSVQLAEKLRAQGHQVRIAAQPGEAITFVIRHGNFASRDEAERRSGDLSRLGLPNHVVRVR
jgi:hypothetical protein